MYVNHVTRFKIPSFKCMEWKKPTWTPLFQRCVSVCVCEKVSKREVGKKKVGEKVRGIVRRSSQFRFSLSLLYFLASLLPSSLSHSLQFCLVGDRVDGISYPVERPPLSLSLSLSISLSIILFSSILFHFLPHFLLFLSLFLPLSFSPPLFLSLSHSHQRAA